jgi:predicted small lipoprotein YifL
MMMKFTQALSVVLTATMVAGLAGCGEKEKAAPPPAPAVPLTVGGTVSGLAGGEVVLQINGADDLTVNANGPFKFPKAQKKGSTYAVTIKTQPATPVKQTCTLAQDSGTIAATPVHNVAVTCTTNSYAVGGTVKGLSVKGKAKGLVLELKGVKEVEIKKNGNFLFPDVRLPDGSDYSVIIKSAPAGQACTVESVNTAPDSDTVNIVAVTCTRKGSRK